MATFNISSNSYLDELVWQTGGDTFNMLNRDATLTVRTDSRVHQNAPSGMKGSFGAQNLTEGQVLIDGRNIRELWFDAGSDVVPATGTTISQGAVSGFMLGVWADLASAPVIAGGAMPVTGFIKFREITGGNFSAGALTGITANATGSDRTSWIEVVAIENSTITVPRLGKYESIGSPNRYLVGETDGTLGQQIQMPTNGAGDSFVPSLYIEDGSGGFDRYSSLLATNGWNYKYLGQPSSMVDDRHYFSKYLTGGKLQLGETISQTGLTYTTPILNTSYIMISTVATSFYTWKDDIAEVHYHTPSDGWLGFVVGNYYYLDVASGDLPDGLYQLAEVVDFNTYRYTAVGGGRGGHLSLTRLAWRITATGHGLDTNDKVYANFTSGSMAGVSGEFSVLNYDANSFYIVPPAGIGGVTTTNGNVTIQWYTEVTHTSHGRLMGHLMDVVFNTGITGKDGTYPIYNIPLTNTYRLNIHNNGVSTTGDLNTTQQLGFIPPAGRKIYINNILLRNTLNATTNTNIINVSLGIRPEFNTDGGGKINISYTDSNWYLNFGQPYELFLENNSIADIIYSGETSTPLKINKNVIGSFIPITVNFNNLTSFYNTSGGEIKDNKIIKANSIGNATVGLFQYNEGMEVARNTFGHLTTISTASYAYYPAFGNNNNFHDNIGIQSSQIAISVTNGFFKDFTYIDKFIGYSNNLIMYANNLQSNNDFIVDGFSIGNYLNVKPVYPTYIANNKGLTLKNFGSEVSPIDFGSDWRPTTTSLINILQSGGINGDVYLRGINVKTRNKLSQIVAISNTDKNVVMENVNVNGLGMYSNLDGFNETASSLRVGTAAVMIRNQTLGTHFQSLFLSDTTGYYQSVANEPSVETTSQFKIIAGTPTYNGAGYMFMKTLGDEMTLEDTIYRKGFTGGRLMLPYFYGYDQTQGRINYWYQLDKGNGWEAEENLFFRATGASTIGQYTATFSDLDGGEIKVGNYCIVYSGTHRILRKVVDVTGSVVTFDAPNGLSTAGSYHFFFNFPNEVINPTQGIKIKIRAKTRITNAYSTWANIFVPMVTTALAQKEKYPTGYVTIEGANPTDIIKAYIYDALDSDPTHNTYIGEGVGSGKFAIVTTPYLGGKFYVVRYDSQGTPIVNTRNFAKDILETDNGIIKVYGGDEVQIAQSETIEVINTKVDGLQTECTEVKIYAKDASHNTQRS